MVHVDIPPSPSYEVRFAIVANAPRVAHRNGPLTQCARDRDGEAERQRSNCYAAKKESKATSCDASMRRVVRVARIGSKTSTWFHL